MATRIMSAALVAFAILCKCVHKTCMTEMRSRRQRVLAEVLRGGVAASQDELVEALRIEGFAVTQATVSRDLDQLGAVRVRRGGVTRYAMADQVNEGPA